MVGPTPKPAWATLTVRSAHVGEQLSRRLERLIVERQIGVDERLPSERELASLLGLSRGTVREAIHELELKGLVVRRPGRGTTVSRVADHKRSQSLLGVMDQEERELLEVFDFRTALEPPIAGRAAERATSTDIDALDELLDQMRTETSPDRRAELDTQFHSQVARSTHNPLFSSLVGLASEWMRSSRRRALQSDRRHAASISGHERIVAALRRRDPGAATESTLAHIVEIAQIIQPGYQWTPGTRHGSVVCDPGHRRSDDE